MSRPVVLLDVDGVICDFTSAFVAECSRVVGRPLDHTKVDQYEVHHWAGLSTKEAATAYAAAKQPGWCRALRPLEGAREFVAELQAIAEVIALTAPMHGPHWHHERVEWLAHEVGILPHDVVFTHRKDLVCGDLLIEDKPENAASWQKIWRRTALLINRPYNASADVPVRRVSSLAEALPIARLRVAVAKNYPRTGGHHDR